MKRRYPKSFDDAYLMPNVKLEIGLLVSWIPSEKQMIYGDYPSFDELLETLKELESDINALV